MFLALLFSDIIHNIFDYVLRDIHKNTIFAGKFYCVVIMNNLGTIIRKRRKTLSITQRDIAASAGIGVNTLTKIERGDVNISFRAVMCVLDALGLDMEIKIKGKM